ncbi:MAG: NAD(P)-binding protein, partial [Chitinophagaceae bacterium]|nr:NAD(P)-binding protein [Chitinophagaceae bacterium]
MDSSPLRYQVAIVGGGLAGLATAILLGKKGYKVALF